MPAKAEISGSVLASVYQRRPIRALVVAGLVLTLPFAAVACGDDDGSEPIATSGTEASANAPSQTSSTAVLPERPRLTFDDLDPNADASIRVYAGSEDTEAAKVVTGTFNPGDVVPAICKATGRTIKSHPENGDALKESNQWVQIEGTPDKVQFATLTYGKIDPQAYQELPDC